MKRIGIIGAVFGALSIAANALAQSVSNEGIALDRFDPADRGSDWFGVSSVNYTGSARPAIGATLDYAHQPLVLRDAAGNEVRDIVSDQVFLHLGASITLADRLNLGLNLPIAVLNSGGTGTLNGVTYGLNQGAALGDLRLGANYRVLGDVGGAFRGALGLHFYLPTGSTSSFSGDGGVRVMPSLQVAGDIDAFAYAATLGWAVHGRNSNFAGEAYGSDLQMKVAAGVWAMERRLLIGPELYASSPVSDGGNGFLARRTTPVELLLGAHMSIADNWRAGLGIGPGLSQGLGSPEVRVVASLEWAPAAESKTDRDGDGVEDSRDACPERAGSMSADPSLNGCPLADRDGDGIADNVDACPEQAGPANADAKLNGCPAATGKDDRDGDGILDTVDACPEQAGPANADSKLNGCPMPDRDGDGVLDAQDSCPDVRGNVSTDPAHNGCPPDDDGDGIPNSADACPKEAGVKNADPAKNGCPLAKVDAGQIIIVEQVQFATGNADILASSNTVLEAVLKVLTSHPEIEKVSIEGHTDNRGGADLNRWLSQRRAAAVMKWLTDHGVKAERLHSAGFGPDRPLVDNDSEAGRQKNRRVEFHIVGPNNSKSGATNSHQ